MPLSVAAIKSLKAGEKTKRLYDERGLYLEVSPRGGKWWRFKYRFQGKERRLSLGTYPDVSLKRARERRDEARRLVADGIDPGELRKAARAAREDSFETVARVWLARQEVSKSTTQKYRWLLSMAYPALGHRPISEITPRELLDVLRQVEASGRLETAKRLKITCGQVFRYAIIEGKAETDPTASLRGALKAPKAKHHAAVTEPKAIGALLRAIETYDGHFVTLAALRLAPLVFVRPGELRRAEWAEIDLEAAEWRIPADKMKLPAPHIVPLSRQAVNVLKALHQLTGPAGYVFPSIRTSKRPMSENTITGALRRLGYTGDEMTGHGFRSMAATRLNEMGWNRDAIERQLAHAESNKVREAYTHAAEYLPERRRMMQAWADYLDSLRGGADVVAIGARGGP